MRLQSKKSRRGALPAIAPGTPARRCKAGAALAQPLAGPRRELLIEATQSGFGLFRGGLQREVAKESDGLEQPERLLDRGGAHDFLDMPGQPRGLLR